MRKITFSAVLEPDHTDGYSVCFPEFVGCVSYGTDMENAQAIANEAPALHICGMDRTENTRTGAQSG